MGDRLEADARAAKEAGIVGVRLDRRRSRPARFHTGGDGLLTINNLTGLANHLEELAPNPHRP